MRQFLFLVMTGVTSAQTITTHPGVVDLAQNVVTSGQVTFALPPSTDSTDPGVGKFTPSTITCNINMDGKLSGFANGAPNEACVITSNYGGEPGQALSFLGAWNSATSYQTGQAVSYNNAVYISLATENLGNTPATSPSSWSVVVSTASLIAAQNVSQKVVQPSGTTFQSNSTNGELNASLYPGTDIGAKVMAAIADLPGRCGTVMIPAGSYTQTTTIKKPACVGIRGQGAYNTIFNWTRSKGTALVLADVGGTYPQEEVSDLQLNGASNLAATIGIYLGGDPAGVISPRGSFAEHQNFNRVNVRFFGTGVQWGNNAFDNSFSQSVITNNGTGIVYPGNVTGSGESISFFSTSIQNNIVMGINLTGYSDFYFYGSRCDYNATCGLIDGAATAHFFGTHFEQGSNTFLTLGNCCGDPRLNVYISGGQIVESSPTGTDNQIINVLAGSASSRALTMEGTEIIVLHPNTNFVTWSATGSADILNISGIYNTSPTSFTNIASNCAFSRCSIRKVKLSNKVSPSSVAANTCASQDLVFPGIQGTDNVISISSGVPQPGLAVISGKATPGIADHVAVMFCNVTAATIFPNPGIIYTAFLEQ